MKTDFDRKREIAQKIVDFWHTIEFLNQDLFPKNTTENGKAVDLVKKKLLVISNKKIERNIKKFQLYYNLPLDIEISELMTRDDNFFVDHPVCSDVLHLCIGKIKREQLIKALYRILSVPDDRPEEDTNEICFIGLKVDKEGVYIENSLRISPLVWGIYNIYLSGGKVEGQLSSKRYESDLSTFNENICKSEVLQQSQLEELYRSLFDKYMRPLCGSAPDLELEGNIIYSRYDNNKTCLKEEEKAEDISELVKGFYTDDLQLVKESLHTATPDNAMFVDTIDYIVGAYYEHNGMGQLIGATKRVDIRKEKLHIEEWLYADKAPSGKWPSRFNPVLMQQLAINMGICESDELKKIFSVNGPPGTGKTTLLKEIIADNIVKRAALLCEYEKADDAFEKRSFEHGKPEYQNGYDRYSRKYHALKDKRITEFNMLVASCNNAAVENITKELPDGGALLSGLEPSTNDSKDAIRGLEGVTALFDVSKTESKETYRVFREKEEGGRKQPIDEEKSDVYFSWLAHKLMSTREELEESNDVNEWGLISAPMGKSSNVGNYCYNVLKEIIDNFYKKKNSIQNRQEGYEHIRQKFKDQLTKVEGIKKDLAVISRLSESFRERERKNKRSIENVNTEIQTLKAQKQRCLQSIHTDQIEEANSIKKIAGIMDLVAENSNKTQLEQGHLLALKKHVERIQNDIIDKEDNRKFYEILFGRWIKTERLRQIQKLKDEVEELKRQVKQQHIHIETLEKGKIREDKERGEYEKKIIQIRNGINDKEKEINEVEVAIAQRLKHKEALKQLIVKDRNELQEQLSLHEKNMGVINERFWNYFDSDHIKLNTEAQLMNPWITEEYNREREKLFYLALQLHKEFVLSSKACKDNIRNIMMMWKYSENSDNEVCVYSQSDRNHSFVHLLNTLFLLTPVLSTTFASVGRFLKNIREQGSMGLLIIDEAGQASPQVALGALWRSKRAIVVGDPKQVEPVVTDDADVIKKVFSDNFVLPYSNKTISVQEFSDRINRFGSYIKDSFTGEEKWVGCPLVVHRRCINPMFSISNRLSYDGMMRKKTTEAKEENEAKFVQEKTCWIDVSGKEIGNKNHFVHEQGKVALKMIIESFRKYNGLPDMYVISPFTTVINGMKSMVKESIELKQYKEYVEIWADQYCGTVHRFQGKEAKEVIFLLGCDDKAGGAVNWVKPNIVNVAATRAKYRLYIIGDYQVWKKSEIFRTTKSIIDQG
ncbi:AAA domain-containing protein [Paenibacillus pseudetheri]|uniref:DNA helicase n=1 Tax=Paenibacillus pseudetheri TaxID=2897682 RepID=A0ABN8FP99_9BACL|nr:AAA domain-containing protein [Paenibacillus pseudetheri]CAH1059845.1 hypothetical protein PAECIP111894_06058 [Paenibacillus pseudetheri]